MEMQPRRALCLKREGKDEVENEQARNKVRRIEQRKAEKTLKMTKSQSVTASATRQDLSGKRENNLPQIFNQNVRPFLDAIDNLRKFGLDEDLKLPTFVVIGDQSSGKSSILEAISGVQLPRGTGIVTRCPLQLQMKQVKSTKWRATLSYRVDDSEVTKVLKKPSEIDNAIRQAQNEVTGQKDGISETLLTLSIEDKYVPDLTLVDLPGIARVSVGGQAADVPQQIMRLIKKYISRDEALILTVCPCTTDLATTEALKLSQEHDPDSERTFGVLTKADLIDKGNEESILKILNNEVIPLSKGYTIVKCRGQSALLNNESLKETLEKEKIFFQNHDVFRNLDKSQWGIETLSRKLAYDLFSFIKRELPTIRKTIIDKQKIMSDELLNHKVNYPTTRETRLMYTLTTTIKFLKTFGELTEGKYHSQELDRIEKACLKRSKHADMRLIPFIRCTLKTLEKKLVDTPPARQLDEIIEELIEKNQGKEPREFLSYDTFKKLALKFITDIKPSVLQCMETIFNNLQLVLQALLNYYFGRFPTLKANIMIIVQNVLKDAKANCFKDLELILEKETVFFTMDRNFEEKIDSLHALQCSKYAYRKDWFEHFQQPSSAGNLFVVSHPRTTSVVLQNDISKKPRLLPKYIVVYYMLAINRISDNFSHTVLYFLMNNLHTSMESKLPSHVAQPNVYNLIEDDTVGAEERRKVLEQKLDGLEKGIDEIDHLLFSQNFTNNKNKKGHLREREGREEQQSEVEEEIEEQQSEEEEEKEEQGD